MTYVNADEMLKTLNTLVKFNNGVFKSLKQSYFITKTISDYYSGFDVKHAGISPESVGQVAYVEIPLRFAEYGRRSVRRLAYVYEYDQYGITRKWRLRFNHSSDGSSSCINPKGTELEWSRPDMSELDVTHLNEPEPEVKPEDDWVGDVGDKLKLTVTVKAVIAIDGYGGQPAFIYIFHDASGNTLKWKSSWRYIAKDDVIILQGTVKSQDIYKDVKQTVMTRCKVLEVIESSLTDDHAEV